MKHDAMTKLLTAEQAVNRLSEILDTELRDCDEYAVEALECEDLIASKHAQEHPVLFARETKRLLGVFDTQYRRLENHVDAGNGQIIRWLEWLGFTFDPDPVLSATGHAVLRFWR